MFTYGMIALKAAIDGGVDVTGLVSRVGGFLILDAALFADPVVSARFESLFGPGQPGRPSPAGMGSAFPCRSAPWSPIPTGPSPR
ncbi:MAG: hypothetical protein HZT43_00755 [Exiguobacterium profundum]|nr:MAG: hypothetical protein HZT43_00755 [Exiguobacterium profundum]